MLLRTRFFYCLLFSISFLGLPELTDAQPQPTDTLRVGIAGSPPFVVTTDTNNFDGISLEIWEAIADQAGWQYRMHSYGDVSTALAALENNQLDIVVGPVSITAARARKVAFSQPYFQSSLSVMSRKDAPTLWERIAPFFSMRLFTAVCIFLFILGCVGTLLWLAERERSPEQFPPDPPHGIANGMWLAIVTMTTTGYGDRAPITFWGRIIAGGWMVISIIFATSMVAGIASTLTLSGMSNDTITRPEQLSGIKVAVLPAGPAGNFAAEWKAKPVKITGIQTAYKKLKAKQVDAVLFDQPEMLYFLKQHPDKDVLVSLMPYTRSGFGFALPLHSALTHTIDINLLTLKEQGRMERISREWLGK